MAAKPLFVESEFQALLKRIAAQAALPARNSSSMKSSSGDMPPVNPKVGF